ncbi:MAG UNVERIFIED_CONTAM: hypothetical protein LVR18_43370 [Planctomycetaceae bacterium]|jgi:Ca2+-binding RTX toxin-like protein
MTTRCRITRPAASLTFNGGADDDTLINNSDGVTVLVFGGDDGVDSLINNGSNLASLVFSGGAGADTLRVHGNGIGRVQFDGGTDNAADTFNYSGIGAPGGSISFSGGAGIDVLAWRGSADLLTFEGNDGDDIVLLSGSGALSLDGGAGNDTVFFIGDPNASVTLNEAHTGPDDASSDSLDFSSFTAGNSDRPAFNYAAGSLGYTLADAQSWNGIRKRNRFFRS